LNAGENGLTPELGLIWTPPPELGSGKFGTPCDRMQLANASPEPRAAGLGLLDDPHPATASPQLRAVSAITYRLGIDAVVAKDW
jgi:hypothetical protein